MKSLRAYNHSDIFYLGLMMMMIGLPLSKFLMSLAQIVLVVNWLMEGGIKLKLKKFINNKPAVVMCTFYLLYLVGLLHSSDLDYAINELRIKLPLFVLPLILASSTMLKKEKFNNLMLIFIGSVLVGTLVSMSELIGLNNYIRLFFGIPSTPLLDIRKISLFISHIRFSLMICLAIFYLAYSLVYNKAASRFSIFSHWVTILWLLAFLFLIESVTGFFLSVISSILFLGYMAWIQNKLWIKLIIAGFVFIIPFGIAAYMDSMIQEFWNNPPVDVNQLEQFSNRGNPYVHEIENTQVENGNYIWIYVCKDELKKEWNSRSKYDYHGIDNKNQNIEYTLIRFLASKGMRKDADGVQALSGKEIAAIENGIANVNNMNKANLHSRIYNIYWEIDDYLRGGNPTGHSVTQRLEYWKTAGLVIKENLWVGVGTGDVMVEMHKKYIETESRLEEGYRKRPHNQYLSIAASLGLMGLFWFLFTIFSPLYVFPKSRNILYCIFLTIALGSMISEDTLDTQAGVTFFAFFNAFLLFSWDNRG